MPTTYEPTYSGSPTNSLPSLSEKSSSLNTWDILFAAVCLSNSLKKISCSFDFLLPWTILVVSSSNLAALYSNPGLNPLSFSNWAAYVFSSLRSVYTNFTPSFWAYFSSSLSNWDPYSWLISCSFEEILRSFMAPTLTAFLLIFTSFIPNSTDPEMVESWFSIYKILDFL